MKRLFPFLAVLALLPALLLPVLAAEDVSPLESPEAGYMPLDEFLDTYSDGEYDIMPLAAVQSGPNTPVTSSTGLKGIMIDLLGPYEPTITQLRYQAYNSSNYSYVNQIEKDWPWIISAGIFAIVLYSVFRLGGCLLCKQ